MAPSPMTATPITAPRCSSVPPRFQSTDRLIRRVIFWAWANGPRTPMIVAVDLGLMSASMLDRPWEAVLDATAGQGVRWVEACGGGHIPTRHLDPVELAGDAQALRRFAKSLEERELRLSSLA